MSARTAYSARQTGKTALIALTAFLGQETGVSRHNRGPIKAPPSASQYDGDMMYGRGRGVSGGPQLGLHSVERRQSLGQLSF